MGNVRSILTDATSTKSGRLSYNLKEVVRYDYDTWGNCTVTETSNSIVNGENIAQFNPFRWKSQYYDTESGLYYIDGRYYSPETKQYLSAQNIETILSNTTTIYGLNLYTPTITNPLDMASNGYTIETVRELAYDPPELSKWKQFWNSTLGKTVAIVFVAASIALCVVTGNVPALLATASSVIASLAIGGVIAGYQSTVKGKSFWQGYGRYINHNWAQSVAIASVLLMISIGISSVFAARKKIKLKRKLRRAVKRRDYAYIAKYATHNPDANQVMLGKFMDGGPTSYIARAGDSYTYYSLKEYEQIAEIIGEEYMWNINKAFLDQQASLGKAFYSSHNWIVYGGTLKFEVNYLRGTYGIAVIYLQ